MKSLLEEHCRSVFQDFLESLSHFQKIKWEEITQQEEPPDYYLRLDGIQYAVEVTALMEQTEIGNLKLSSMSIVASLWGLVDEVADHARSSGKLSGAYIVSFSGPIHNFSEVKNQVFLDLLSYVEKTQHLPHAPEEIVFDIPRQQVSIKKQHNQKSYIGKIGPGDMKWEGEMGEEVCALLAERIDIKVEKLRHIKIPKILLLYDAYHFADVAIFRACLQKTTTLSEFHTIFLVRNDAPGFVLHSEGSIWFLH